MRTRSKGRGWLLNLIWLHRCHNVHTIIEKASRSNPSLIICNTKSRKLEKNLVLRKIHTWSKLHTSNKHERIHRAWITSSSFCLQWSQPVSVSTLLWTKLSFTSIAFFEAFHKKFFTLFGTERLQINFQTFWYRFGLLASKLTKLSL